MTGHAFITGAAKRVGAALARNLAQQGMRVTVHYHTSIAEAQALVKELNDLGHTAACAQADMTHPGETLEAFTQASAAQPVTLLVHNASVFEKDSLATFGEELFSTHMRVNVETPLHLTRAFASQLPSETSGNVICLLDGMTGWSISPDFLSYSISKRALEGAIPLLAAELAPGVRVNGIALGPTIPGKQDKPSTFARLEELSPLRRVSNPDDVVRALNFLIASESTSGQIIDLSNGIGLRAYARPQAE